MDEERRTGGLDLAPPLLILSGSTDGAPVTLLDYLGRPAKYRAQRV